MSKNTQVKVDELFSQCSASTPGYVEFVTIAKLFWPILDNRISLVDLAGVFSMAIPNHSSTEVLDYSLFCDFINGISKIKYPTGREHAEKLLEDLKAASGIPPPADVLFFEKCAEKNVIRTLLRFDMALRRAFSTFAGKAVSVGGGLTWDEVKRLNLGMEIDGFVAFAGTYSIIPSCLELKQCEALVRDILTGYPLACTTAALNSAVAYPQFQLLICAAALESFHNKSRGEKLGKGKKDDFAKKTTDAEKVILCDILIEFFKTMGIDKSMEKSSSSREMSTPSLRRSKSQDGKMGVVSQPPSPSRADSELAADSPTIGGAAVTTTLLGTVAMPSYERSDDRYLTSMNHNRQAMLLRMEHIFDQIETELMHSFGPGSEVILLLSSQIEDHAESRFKVSSKPVVIGDAIPVPETCPENVSQLLEAALAHHNLGSYQEALKFLEACRVQLVELERKKKAAAAAAAAGAASASGTPLTSPSPLMMTSSSSAQLDEAVPFDLDMYITVCKGNVYQSCGDDEQALMQYLAGWSKAKEKKDFDWEIVALNSIGMLAYYNLRYDIGLMCFSSVISYRSKAYGPHSADTASAQNNEACCMFCLGKRAEARVRFEQSWNLLCAALGHRAPRSVQVWKNLEKCRRAHGSLHGSKNIRASVEMRPDSDRLLCGGEFIINALPPPDGGKKKKGKKKGGKKKK